MAAWYGQAPWDLDARTRADPRVARWVRRLWATHQADLDGQAAQATAAAQAQEEATLRAQGRTPIAGPSPEERAAVEARSGLMPGASLGRT